MAVPLFDTSTPLAPLRDALHSRLAEVLDAGRTHTVPDMARLQTGITAVEEAFGVPARLRAAQLYVPDFLPPAADRRV